MLNVEESLLAYTGVLNVITSLLSRDLQRDPLESSTGMNGAGLHNGRGRRQWMWLDSKLETGRSRFFTWSLQEKCNSAFLNFSPVILALDF